MHRAASDARGPHGRRAAFEAPEGSTVAPASFGAEQRLPSKRILSSGGLGWRSILARGYDDPAETEEWTTAPTPDLLIVINVSGSFTMEARRPGGWSRARYEPGAIGVTAPGARASLRWRLEPSEQRRSLHLFVSAVLLHQTAEALGDLGLLTRLPDVLRLDDPVVLATGRALWSATEQRADALHGDSLAQALALHMLYGRRLGSEPPRSRSAPVALTDASIGRALDYMHEHLGEAVSLDDLAEVANISKFHFLRLFRQATGLTPHRYLARLRIERAAALLRTSSDTVQWISAVCGYASPRQFATAFRRHYGVAPTEYRRQSRR